MFGTRAPRRLITLLVTLGVGSALVTGWLAPRQASAESPPEADASATPPAKPTTKDWDQASVTSLSKELAVALKGVRAAFRKEPTPNIASGQSRARHDLLDLLRQIESGSRQLNRQLEAGDGRDATQPDFDQLLSNIRKAQDLRAKVFAQDQTLKAIDKARDPLTALTEYYGAEVPVQRRIVR